MVNLEQELEQPQGSSATFTASSVPGVDAAEVRVTPEELTQALSAVESRREQSSQHLASTIRLGEAVDQLGLHVTPEELLAEIAAQRVRALYPPIIVRKRLGKWQRRAYVAALCVTMVFAALAGLYFVARSPLTATVREVSATRYATTPSYPTLAEVPDGQFVQCDFVTLQSLARGAGQGQTRVVGLNERDAAGLWSIVKRNGKVLVRCFAPQGQAVGILNGKGGIVTPYESQAVSEGYMGVEVPISLFKGVSQGEKITSRRGERMYDALRIPAS